MCGYFVKTGSLFAHDKLHVASLFIIAFNNYKQHFTFQAPEEIPSEKAPSLTPKFKKPPPAPKKKPSREGMRKKAQESTE